MRTSLWYIVLALLLIAGSAAFRVLEVAPNVSPIAAIALLGGASLPVPLAFIVPLAAMVVSDVFIGFDELPITLSVYSSFLAVVLLGRWLRTSRGPWRIAATSLAGSILFYLVTNAAVWWFSGMYERTVDGLILSYLYALPFFRNTLLGDLVFVGSLFLAVQYVPIAARWMARRANVLRTKAQIIH